MRALGLDLRLVGSRSFLGVIAVLVVVGCAVTGSLVLAWPIVAGWVSACGLAHRDMEQSGRVGALQSVLGIPRGTAVRTRYMSVVVIAAALAVLGAVTALAWTAFGRDLTPVWGYFAVLVFALAFGLINLTLGYTASTGVRQAVAYGLIVIALAVTLTPIMVGANTGWSTAALVEVLYAGPVPPVVVAGLMAIATLTLGSPLAVRAHSRAVL